jgi:hypothetical protein
VHKIPYNVSSVDYEKRQSLARLKAKKKHE